MQERSQRSPSLLNRSHTDMRADAATQESSIPEVRVSALDGQTAILILRHALSRVKWFVSPLKNNMEQKKTKFIALTTGSESNEWGHVHDSHVIIAAD